MRKVLAVAIVAVMALPGLAAAQSRKGTPKKAGPAAALKPTVQVAGLRVVGPGFGPEEDRKSAFFGSTGVTVVVAVRVPPPYALVELDKDKSSLAMADSQGTALEQPEVDWSPDYTKDGTTALVDLDGKGVPAEGSSHVALKGSLLFKVAGGTKTVKVRGLKLAKGTPLKLGTSSLTLGDVEKDDDGVTVMFESTRPVIKGIRTMRARDAKGAEIESRWSSSGTWTGEDGYQSSYHFKTKAEALNLEVDMWDGLREVTVPFDLKAGVAIPVQ